jgi:hypothetical protein
MPERSVTLQRLQAQLIVRSSTADVAARPKRRSAAKRA